MTDWSMGGFRPRTANVPMKGGEDVHQRRRQNIQGCYPKN